MQRKSWFNYLISVVDSPFRSAWSLLLHSLSKWVRGIHCSPQAPRTNRTTTMVASPPQILTSPAPHNCPRQIGTREKISKRVYHQSSRYGAHRGMGAHRPCTPLLTSRRSQPYSRTPCRGLMWLQYQSSIPGRLIAPYCTCFFCLWHVALVINSFYVMRGTDYFPWLIFYGTWGHWLIFWGSVKVTHAVV